MPRKSIPAIPVGVLRVHGAHSVFRLFRIFNYFFSRAISPSPAGISRALSQSVPISIFHFAVFRGLKENKPIFEGPKTRPPAAGAAPNPHFRDRPRPSPFFQNRRKFHPTPRSQATHHPR